jgi:hypothetical protein
MEDLGYQWAEEPPPSVTPPLNYTLGKLLGDLRQFGETYQRDAEQIRQLPQLGQPHARLRIAAEVSQARESLLYLISASDA